MKQVYTPDFKTIPNHASTHYVHNIYPTKPISQKTCEGFVSKPKIQRKTSKEGQSVFSIEIRIEQNGTARPQMARNTFRNNIDKEALAEYFNGSSMSYEEKKQENLEDMVAELEASDTAKAAKNVSAKELHDFVVAYLAASHDKRPTKSSEFNESVAQRFLNKYRGSDTSAAMRAFDKKKRHSTKLAYFMHELGLTK